MDGDDVARDEGGALQFYVATELYVLADQLGDILLQNKIIDFCIKLKAIVSRNMGPNAISLARGLVSQVINRQVLVSRKSVIVGNGQSFLAASQSIAL